MVMRVLGIVFALVMVGFGTGTASAAVAGPAGDVISIGDPDALGQIDLYVDPLCPFSGDLVRSKGAEIGRRIEGGSLRVNLRFVDYLQKRSASGDYDDRAIYAAFVVAAQSGSSDVTWRFIEAIYAEDQQPHEHGATDLSNSDLASLALTAGAPQSAADLIRSGVRLGFDPWAIAASNLSVLKTFPEPGVPTVVIDGAPVDGESDWLARLTG